MSLVSIITPAYKAEHTITRAVRSVQAQTYLDWEMIIVSDDGQDYERILKDQKITDSRLRFASTGGVGVGPSRGRNIAIDMARGEFITTLDADDEYDPRYLEDMHGAAEIYGAAMVRLSHKRKADGNHQGLFGPDAKPEAYCSLTTFDDYLVNNGRAVTMFARRILKEKYNETIRYGEDFFFDVRFFEHAKIIPLFHEELYIYHYNEDSLTANVQSSDEAIIANYKLMIEILEANKNIAPELRNNLLAMYHHRLFQNYIYLNARDKGECKDFYEFMEQHPEYFHTSSS